MRERYTPEQRQRGIDALWASARANKGPPTWERVMRETGLPKRFLKRLWTEENEEPAPGSPPTRGSNVVLLRPDPEQRREQHAPPPDAHPTTGAMFDAGSADAVTYWSWRWVQTQVRLSQVSSDIAMIQLLKMQDDIWASLRAAIEQRAASSGTSPEEIAARLRDMALRIAPDHAEVIIEALRARKLIA